ncbi:D-alanine--poly(phosphoribitol) ligase subunit DltA [Hydrogenoanaerobacterium sp.]|uniref:D-alanine--poly(phosphoribitol) ligase subunit DltA n=1 Tax=Hydrogenoanaerobacterium sp. TaxID=2953763 RepID=UPI00289ACA25|nr:D-alanine--poly(phosphoribitol) ligase subunit DltA [Hydrogenoanaerobacterium sp.]
MKLLEQIQHYGRVTPNAPAYRFKGQTLTYAQLCERADRIARQILHKQPQNRSPIAVFGGKSLLMLLCFVACMKAGRAYLPIDCGTPPQRIQRMLALAGAGLVLATDDFSAKYCPVWSSEELWRLAEQEAPQLSLNPVSGGDIAYIIFTSGSTGDPKGVRVTADNLDGFLDWSASLTKGQIYLNQSPFSFDLSVMSLYTPLYWGGCSVSVDYGADTDFSALFTHLSNSKAEVWVSTPSFAKLCLFEGSFTEALLPRMHTFLFCGEPLQPATVEELFLRFPRCRILNTYGPTEATVAVTSVEITREMCGATSLPAGRAMPGTALQILNQDGTLVPNGEKGEVAILGGSVAAGYVQPGSSRFDCFGELPRYRTGDLGRLQGDMLYLEGRSDDQLKYHGYRVELGDIEANLLRLPYVAQAAVLPKMRGGQVQSLTAFAVLRQGEPDLGFATAQRIRADLKHLLPGYLVPRRIVLLKELPLTENGKLNRNKLREQID